MSLVQALNRPVPDQTAAREQKQGFRDYPLVLRGVHADEPVVDIALYGLAGQNYYSRPNGATNDPVPGVEPAVYLRRSIAEKLAEINRTLQLAPEVAEIFGGEVELYVQDGLRPLALQKQLYQEVFPRLIRAQFPDLTPAQVRKRRDQLIANPKCTPDSPPPHATGAAVDVTLRYKRAELGYVSGSSMNMGRSATDVGSVADPDYFEYTPISARQLSAQTYRRAYYWILRGAVLGEDTGFVVNPTEWWHWSYGDQLWAKLTEAPAAFFGEAKID